MSVDAKKVTDHELQSPLVLSLSFSLDDSKLLITRALSFGTCNGFCGFYLGHWSG